MNEKSGFNPEEKSMSLLTTPLSMRGWPKWVVYLMALIGIIYILNPSAGLLEFIPDNIPFVGKLDEGAAAFMIWLGLVELLEGKNDHPVSEEAEDAPIDADVIEIVPEDEVESDEL